VFIFNLFDSDGTPYDTTGCTVEFAVSDYVTPSDVPLIIYDADLDAETSTATVTLYGIDTALLFGRYIYHLFLRDAQGGTHVLGQGALDINRNIYPAAAMAVEE